jgi:hypothetical protein
MRLSTCLLAAGTLLASTVHAEEASKSYPPARLHLIDDGSGDSYGARESWTPDGRNVGLGVQLGFPTALTLEFATSSYTSVVLGLGAFGYRFFTPAISIYGDHLWHLGGLGSARSINLSWYVGVGAWVTVYRDGYQYTGYGYGGDSNLALAARVPIGLDLALGEVPLMFYAELVPALLVYPAIDVGLGASIGARIFF